MPRCFFLCVTAAAILGCSDSSRDNKSTSTPVARTESADDHKLPRKNPLVGKWRTKKADENWTANVSKQAVVEFLNDGETMRITNNNGIQAEANYLWQGDKFTFQARFTRPDGSKNGVSALVIVEKITDDEIAADY